MGLYARKSQTRIGIFEKSVVQHFGFGYYAGINNGIVNIANNAIGGAWWRDKYMPCIGGHGANGLVVDT